MDDAALRLAAADSAAVYFGEELLPTPHSDRSVAVRALDQLSREPPSNKRSSSLQAARDLLLRASPPNARGSSSSADPEAERLSTWARDFLPDQTSLQLCCFERTGRGLAASESGLAAGEVALRVPVDLVLTSERVLMHPTVGPALVDCGIDVHEDILLSLALLLEEGDAWVQYRTLLPDRPPGALLWSSDQLARMGATPLPEQVEAVRGALADAHAQLFPRLSERLPQVRVATDRACHRCYPHAARPLRRCPLL